MKALIDTFFQRYLSERDLEATLDLMIEDVISVGTGEQEVARGKAELRRLIQSEFAELPSPFQYKIYNYMQTPVYGNACNGIATLRVCSQSADNGFEMNARFTCSCVRVDGAWKIASLHMSVPSREQAEGMFFPLHYGTQAALPLSTDSGMKLAELMARAIPGGVMGGYLDEGYPLYAINDRMLDILGYTYAELIEATNEKMMNIIHVDDRARVEMEIDRQFREKNEYQIEYRAIGKHDRIIWVNDIGKKIVTEDGREAMISVVTDITERVERETQLIRDAEYDCLTNLYNRKKAMALIGYELSRNAGGMLFMCDVNNFKSVNDTCGHVTGDLILVQLAAVMRKHAGASAILARIGGDENALFFPNSVSIQTAVDTMRAIQAEFLENMLELIPELNVSLSVGGQSRTGQEDLHTLYQLADEALYLSKRKQGELVVR